MSSADIVSMSICRNVFALYLNRLTSCPGLQCGLLMLLLLFTSVTVKLAYANEHKGFVGSQTCESCHQQAYSDWQGSHHAKAMAHASEDSVLANFDNVEVVFNGETYRFYRQEQDFFARIKDKNGEFQSYQIEYTFGVYPLQQYMVDVGQGKIQLIPFAWDSREKQLGGQRWFHLYPEALDTKHEFFWTNQGQNWNYMCADCHSTNIRKNYNLEDKSYGTTFAEISVGCEACHGPGENHLDFVNQKTQPGAAEKTPDNAGFDRSLHKLVQQWQARPDKSILQPVLADNADASRQTLVCAQCHSRRLQLGNQDFIKSNEFADTYLLNLLEPGAYHVDGQIYDEVYVYGSYLQSKMHQQGVVCSNCHQPHSAKLLIEGNGLCSQCHIAEQYDTPEHHHHPDSTPGSQCVDCHMPQTTYMQVDPRRDHRWLVPNPKQSADLGAPDVCLSCHEAESQQWSIDTVRTWQGDKENQSLEFGRAFLGGEVGYPQSATWLSKLAQDINNPDIIRASALQRSATVADKNSLVAISRSLKSSNSWVRIGAIRGSENLPVSAKWRLLSPLIDDAVLGVRIEVMRMLLANWQSLSPAQKQQLKPAMQDYIKVQEFNADRGFALANLANLYAYQGDYPKAKTYYLKAIDTEPYYPNSYLNLAELYRQMFDEKQVIETLNQGASAVVNPAALYYQAGLSYIRQKRPDDAEQHFAKAISHEPGNPQYQFVYGLSVKQSNPKQAQQAMAEAFALSQNPQYLYALCELQIQQQEFAARQCIEELRPLVNVEVIKQLENQLKP
ncbi:multiheme c-type cytochrome [Thalassotalea sp. PS06]|uniref:multiheme c-type cytochrome n=1 Tax=Thalassotalea sp. PS06 TaxID=2594005 RepID=UPI001162E8AE|nr:multiheme c-type cytochrome [Thalassotalea sp. PS06]QDP01150.1 tetratricopeptide repeat protein [Thalassotalea sp. PS06]